MSEQAAVVEKNPEPHLERTLIEVRNLTKHFPIKGGIFGREVGSIKAVDGVSFTIRAGETLGLVGESGCGKTTIGRLLLNLVSPTSGEVYFDIPPEIREKIRTLEKEPDSDELKKLNKRYMMFNLSNREMRRLRREMQIVFQDPFSSLNPRMLVKDIVGEPIDVHRIARGVEKTKLITELLAKVGLNPEHMYRFPHEFSGGQRQRIGIARALALRPKLLVLDEPTSALDVSVQAQILNLLQRIQKENGLTYIFISHHLSVIRHMSNRVAVMYLGKIVEIADTEELFKRPLHPYTQALLSAIPVPDPTTKRQRIILEGDVPSPANPPLGCRFHTRCKSACETCGWGASEVKDVLQKLVDREKENRTALKAVKSVRSKDKLTIAIGIDTTSSENASSVANALREAIKDDSSNDVKLRALRNVVVEGDVITIALPKPVEPVLVDVGNGHFVACTLACKGQEGK